MFTMFEFGGFMLVIDPSDRTVVTLPESHPDGILLRQVSKHPTFVAACEWVKRNGHHVQFPPTTAITSD
jgi:hypothetical protein